MPTSSTTDKVKALLHKHGVGERQQIKKVASILNIAYVSARQKFAGDRNWSNEQLAQIARHFHEPIEELAIPFRAPVSNGILLISDIPQRCICEVGEVLVDPRSESFVARQEGDTYIITTGATAEAGLSYLRVIQIHPVPSPVVASLDDIPDISEGITRSFAKKGIAVKSFVDPDLLLETASEGIFEYYILDWTLNDNRTANYVIEKIRTEISTQAPIIILTGNLRTHHLESEIADLVSRFDEISVLEKPVLNLVMANTIYKKLFFRGKNISP